MQKFLWLAPLGVVLVFNFYLSGLTWQEVRKGIGWVRNIPQQTEVKTRHIVQYAPQSAYATFAFAKSFSLALGPARAAAFIVVGTLGGLTEYYQAFIPTRIPSWVDVFWNFLGALVGVLFTFPLDMFFKRFTK